MIFYKTVCSGNDFIHIDLNDLDSRRDQHKSDLARHICNRNSGAGADGVVYFHAKKKSVDFEIFNQDGSQAEISGNGMAGLATVLFHLNIFHGSIKINTPVGSRSVELLEKTGSLYKLRIEIGIPDFKNFGFFPFLKKDQMQYYYEDIGFYPVSVGNPHAVVLLSGSYSQEKRGSMAKKLADSPMFPGGTNVELVDPEREGSVPIYFYERGVGRTLFSSTGSAAVYAILRRLNEIKAWLLVRTSTENIKLGGGDHIFLENFSKIVYKGIYWK